MKPFSSTNILWKDTFFYVLRGSGGGARGSGCTPWPFSAGAKQELIPQERVGSTGPLEAWPLGR